MHISECATRKKGIDPPDFREHHKLRNHQERIRNHDRREQKKKDFIFSSETDSKVIHKKE
jgi:hypothetical protein